MIKLQIYCHASNLNHRRLYTHDLDRLIQYGISLDIPFYVPLKEKDTAKVTSWESSGRYDLRFSIRVDTLERYLNLTKNWFSYLYSRGFR